ncbi:hypothetical protein F2Q69_00020032 [Brassica cretica]|uniref:Protein kinase domain-containing protein n=1 Tax=Brassica cretica TaxID=69181 RepID=A0A8S9QBC4_BRACR|nr:hypothetical protein F2Q69_00020032 [Brassica cretica]
MGEDDPRRGHLPHGRGRPARGHLPHGRGRPAPRSPRPWARTTLAEVTSPMGEDDPRRGHLPHGRGRPAPRSPRPWARMTRTEVNSPMGEDRPPVLKPCILVKVPEKINVKFAKIIMKGDEKWENPSRDESGPGRGANRPREGDSRDLQGRLEVSIPVSESTLHTLRLDNPKKSLEQGFNLEIKQDCSVCLESKGACGYNHISSGFVCYCDDATHGQNCGSGRRSKGSLVNAIHKGSLIKPICKVLGSVAGVVLFVILLSFFLHFLRKRELRLRQQNLMSLIPLKHYTYAKVKRITKSFAEVVGRGGFGIVYRGTLSDGRMVAVRDVKRGSKRAIIYEFLGNGSLDKFISRKSSVNLDWATLYQIALGVARGLEYLHHGCKTRIVHFDIKPQNVLLDEDFCPIVSDFGLAKLCEKKESVLSLLDTRGTVGYIAPEMISRVYGSVSHKSDVYSYGMLVLEMIGARNKESAHQDSASNTSSIYFPEWVYRDLELGKPRRLIENGINNEEEEVAKKMALVGLWCIQPSPLDRPPINRVVEMMEGSLEALEVPPRPVLQQIPTAPLQESLTLSGSLV